MEERPAIDYLSKDFASFRQAMLDRLSATLPQWQERHLPDLGVTLVDLLAYVGDYLSYYQDAVATEAYLGTARQRISVRRHAKLLDYTLHEGCNARTWVQVSADRDGPVSLKEVAFVAVGSMARPSIGTLSEAELSALPAASYQVFEPVDPTTLEFRKAHQRMNLASKLEKGATQAEISADGIALEPGMVLILMPTEAASGDKPPAGHPVKLEKIRTHGPSQCTVIWHQEDALPERLAGRLLSAQGNNVFVDHGRTIQEQVTVKFDRLGPLSAPWLSHRAPMSGHASRSAAGMLLQDPRSALAEIRLHGPDGDWTNRPDLLESLPSQRHFCTEIDDRGRAFIRFGDGKCGRAVDTNGVFTVRYRLGNGSAGNVAAGTITTVLYRQTDLLSGISSVHNPLPATGGLERESLVTARMVAPGRMRVRQQRAISPQDYANFAREVEGVQQATAVIIREGAHGLVRVVIDPVGYCARRSSEADWRKWQELARRVVERLEPVRRINHEVVVAPPAYIDLRLHVAVEVLPRQYAEDVLGQVRRVLFGTTTLSDSRRKIVGESVLPESALRPMFHPDNQTLGQPIYWSKIVSAIHNVPGVARVEQRKFERTDRAIAKDANAIADIELGPQEVALMQNDDRYFDLRLI